ncbi:hypothetical protein GCM10010193_69370 [Kitasatospora atroaurantiaca]|uniref:Uncharacterized protein n=1 Tax=Kitasatospora atroaurantiaca TaxID=285545 RepID=A0A561EN30_9ACTN|nr:hypothetical protein [Kitasatospora atroaurantiaca]TWE17026.1 hypothetical protein FB465_2028 [Kitasatospora atroaurantiaca]
MSTIESPRPYQKHRPHAAACRAEPEVWHPVRTYPTLATAKTVASNIRTGKLPAYLPRGSFEAEIRGGRNVWARFMGVPVDEQAEALERARTAAVALEQENARLCAVIVYLLTGMLATPELTLPSRGLDAVTGRVELTERDGVTRIEVTEGEL